MCSGLSPKLSAMLGMAVFIMVVSSVCMKKPIATSHKSTDEDSLFFMPIEQPESSYCLEEMASPSDWSAFDKCFKLLPYRILFGRRRCIF